MRTPIKGLVTLALVLAFTPAGRAQTGGGAESNTHASRTSRHHVLPATPQNCTNGNWRTSAIDFDCYSKSIIRL